MIFNIRLYTLLIIALFLASPLLRSQITLTHTDGPRPGDSLIAWFITDSVMTAAAPAIQTPVPGQTWNFSLPGWARGFGYLRASIVSVPGTIFDTSYPGAALGVMEEELNDSTGFRSTAISFLRPQPNLYEDMGTASFYLASKTAARAYILISKKTGYGNPLPLAFGNERIAQSHVLNVATPYDTMYPPEPRRRTEGMTTLSTTVDGWGTIITTFGTFPALRVHRYETSIDSLYDENGEQTDVAVDTIETYDWYTRELGASVPAVSIEVYEGEIVSAFVARRIGDPIPTEGVDDVRASRGLFAFPNPATDRSTLAFPPQSRPLTLHVCSTLGERLLTIDIPGEDALHGSTQLDLSSLPTGLYLVRLDGVGAVVVGRGE